MQGSPNFFVSQTPLTWNIYLKFIWRSEYCNNVTHLHVYNSMPLNGRIDMQVNKLNIYIFSV